MLNETNSCNKAVLGPGLELTTNESADVVFWGGERRGRQRRDDDGDDGDEKKLHPLNFGRDLRRL